MKNIREIITDLNVARSNSCSKEKSEEIKKIINDLLPHEKQEKALEIIKKFPYELTTALAQPTYEMYCLWFANFKDVKPKLNENQYNIIREVMKCQK